jgi:hypothetical protein
MQDLTVFKTGQLTRAKLFDQVKGGEHSLSTGIGAGFARVTYKGGKWGTRYQGKTEMTRKYKWNASMNKWDDDGPQDKLDIVIIAAAEHPSKYWYKSAYDPNQEVFARPDCWASDGIKPDSGVAYHPGGKDKGGKQSETCVTCPHDGWGSARPRADGRPSRGKACTDHKRLVVVPVSDIENKAYGGPMLLQVPPTSLKLLPVYENRLGQAGFRFFEVWTQVRFDEKSEFPLFEFDCMAPLNDEQAAQVIRMMNDPLVERILTTDISAVEGYDTPTDSADPSVSQPPAPPVNQPAPRPSPMSPPMGMLLPPAANPPAPDPQAALLQALKGLSAEQIAQLLGQQATEEKAKPRRRTPPPSPKEQDLTQEASKPQAVRSPGPTLPANANAELTAGGNGHDQEADDDTAARILAKIGSLVNKTE